MPTPMLPVGPYRTLKTADGADFPYYIIPFDKAGACEGPRTRDDLIAKARGYSDIFVFSHGWNNDWTVATRRYESFITGVTALRAARGLPAPPGYRPLLAGIFWPSQALAWFDSETGPDIAGSGSAAADATAQDEAAREMHQTVRDIASALPAADRARFYDLAQAQRLEAGEALELAQLLAGMTVSDDEGLRDGSATANDLLAAAASLEAPAFEPEPDWDDVGTIGGSGGGGSTTGGRTATAPTAAGGVTGLLKALDPRALIKPFTLYLMKDRAGTVGAYGVAPLLAALLEHSQARVHLLGHSYGCKVVMTAVCRLPDGARPVESALLLQPAVSQYAFAPVVPERGRAGGFVPALERVRRPIVSTFSAQDSALSRSFHLALRRHDDLGELQLAGGDPHASPNKFGALGGYGPQASRAVIDKMHAPVEPYDLSGTGHVLGVDGTGTITGHGEISNESTWWLAYQLATAHMRA